MYDCRLFFLSQAFAACQYAQATELKPYDIGMIQGDTKSPLREGLREVSPLMHGGKECISINSRVRIRVRLQSKHNDGEPYSMRELTIH